MTIARCLLLEFSQYWRVSVSVYSTTSETSPFSVDVNVTLKSIIRCREQEAGGQVVAPVIMDFCGNKSQNEVVGTCFRAFVSWAVHQKFVAPDIVAEYIVDLCISHIPLYTLCAGISGTCYMHFIFLTQSSGRYILSLPISNLLTVSAVWVQSIWNGSYF